MMPRRDAEKGLMSGETVPLRESWANASPMEAENLKPCPEQAET